MEGERVLMDPYDELKAVLERRALLGLRCPTFDPDALSEHECRRWLRSMTDDLERDELVRRLTLEQHS